MVHLIGVVTSSVATIAKVASKKPMARPNSTESRSMGLGSRSSATTGQYAGRSPVVAGSRRARDRGGEVDTRARSETQHHESVLIFLGPDELAVVAHIGRTLPTLPRRA